MEEVMREKKPNQNLARKKKTTKFSKNFLYKTAI
jgi:hypothetical protein